MKGHVSDEGFVVRPIAHNHPAFLLIPVTAGDMASNAARLTNNVTDNGCSLVEQRYPGKVCTPTASGRHALELVLRDIGVQRGDNVAIYTTTGNCYISGCVTQTIESRADWIREGIDGNTRAILVNHEFGYPFDIERLRALRRFGLPIIEDCAYSMGCHYENGVRVGSFGDYAIFSLPKYLPAQVGGFALSAEPLLSVAMSNNDRRYVEAVLATYYPELESIAKNRCENHLALAERLQDLGIRPLLKLNQGAVPGVFLFRYEGSLDYPALKEYLWAMGVQCSVFYGKEAFFLPCHQASSRAYMDMIHALLKAFIDEY